MLFDNIKDPFQMNNLVNKSAFKTLQDKLDGQLQVALQKIGDDFKPKEYYMTKWNYTLDPQKNAIDYWSWGNGKQGVVVSPKHN
jgi:hypothetical protein